MWKPLFDWFVQLFSGVSWSQFLAQHNENADAVSRLRNVFRNDLYPITGTLLVIVTILSVFLFYFVFNRKRGAGYGYKTKYWFIFFLSTATIIGVSILSLCIITTGSFKQFNPLKFSLALSVASMLYSAILFFFISLIVKRFSVANRTPF